MRVVPPGGGIVLALAVMVPFWIAVVLLFAGCAWAPWTMRYPSGMSIARLDQAALDKACGRDRTDAGYAITFNDRIVGCYDKRVDTVFLLNNCDGAEALPHELAHREGIKDPEKGGYNW